MRRPVMAGGLPEPEPRSNLIVVVCGSASWMIAKVLRDRGGLHNRVTRRMQLHPEALFAA
jgi:hypothetical protein